MHRDITGETLMKNEWEKPGYEDDDLSDEDDMFWGEESDEL